MFMNSFTSNHLLFDLVLFSGPIPLMIGAELFRQAPRPKAMGVAAVTNWVGTFIIAMVFESLQVTQLTLFTLFS